MGLYEHPISQLVWRDSYEPFSFRISGSNSIITENCKGKAMKKRRKDKSKIILAFVLLLLVAVIADATSETVIENGHIKRGQIGQKKDTVELEIYVEGMLEKYPYLLEVEPVFPTKEEAETYLEETIKRIEDDFAKVEEKIPFKNEYLNGKVKAEWSFLPFGVIDLEGNINREKLYEEKNIIEAQVELNCGNYEKFYEFSFLLQKPQVSETETLLQEIESQIEEQLETEGNDSLILPTQINGKDVEWSEKREYLTPQILVLEGIAIVLIWVFSRKKKQEDQKKRIIKMEEDYSDIVNQLALLLGAGMTARQAWNRLGRLYVYKKNSQMIKENAVYEAILRMNGRFSEGESERVVYQKFCEEIPASCYHKLMRILLGSLEKGTKGVEIRLEEESRSAFEQRILLAKKRGEEASTKMLVPLMLMMLIVMGIVMLPALFQFQI